VKNILFSLMTIIIIATNANAFTFDVWESGMDVDTVMMVALKNDIPLRKSGYAAIDWEGFDKEYKVPYRKGATEYGYSVNLLGENARVKLFMTEKEKILMKIEISWAKGKEVKEMMEKIILAKNPISSTKSYKMLGETTRYKINYKDEIELEYQLGILIAIYKDTVLMKKDRKTKKKKKQKTKNSVITKDASRF